MSLTFTTSWVYYKDLQSFIMSVNIKFLTKLNFQEPKNWMALPILWISQLFNIKLNPNIANPLEVYESELFCGEQFNILSCRFKLPRANQWKGHMYFYEILKGFEKLISREPQNIEDLLSTPIWFDRTIKTKFDCFQKTK